jgi:hypothetical protein
VAIGSRFDDSIEPESSLESIDATEAADQISIPDVAAAALAVLPII